MNQSRSLRRQEQLLELLTHHGEATVEELAQRLDVSVWTIRRDLNTLEERGALQRLHGKAELPAATAIGHPRRSGRFQLYWLAAREAGTPLENPRQTQAWRYPRQYGPQAPGFARALLPADASMPLLLSGTAAVVGHASQHGDSLAAQLDETLANLDSLLATARLQRPGLPEHFGTQTPLKVYVRDADTLAHVTALLDARLPADLPRIVLHGHVCRRELAVEIDGSHA